MECFEYLLRSFAIGLKENCLEFVEKQLQELAEKVPSIMCLFVYVYNYLCRVQRPSERLKEQIREFVGEKSASLVEVSHVCPLTIHVGHKHVVCY